MRLFTWVLSGVTVLALAVAPASADVFVTLDPPDGALYGEAGQVLGWGLTIENDASGWLVITSATYDETTSIGLFMDFITPQFLLYALPPNGAWTQTFDALTSSGLGSYVIDGSFALPGDMAVGNLDLLYDIHSIDPNGQGYDPSNDTISGYQVLLPASVTYQNGPEVPEPATTATILTGLAVLGLGKRARRRW